MPDTQSPGPSSRVADMSADLETSAAVMSILALPPKSDRVEAFGLFPGLGEIARDHHAISLFTHNRTAKYLIMAGENPDDKPGYNRTPANLVKTPWNIPPGLISKVFTQVYTANTKTQADWMAENVKARGVKSLGLTVSAWHMPRAYLTLVKSLMDAGMHIAVLPQVAEISFSATVPGVQKTVWELLAAELRRIPTYQQTGDIATYSELNEYIDWLWKQPIMKD